MSSRSVARLSRVGASPIRSAINSRNNGSLFTEAADQKVRKVEVSFANSDSSPDHRATIEECIPPPS